MGLFACGLAQTKGKKGATRSVNSTKWGTLPDNKYQFARRSGWADITYPTLNSITLSVHWQSGALGLLDEDGLHPLGDDNLLSLAPSNNMQEDGPNFVAVGLHKYRARLGAVVQCWLMALFYDAYRPQF